jgi:5-methylcytosine-specific restriction endonuclease McrA
MNTPRSVIKGHLRRIFLRSKERAECMKRHDYSCVICGIKQSKAKGREVKIEVDHIYGIDIWDEVINLIQEKILCSDHPEKLQTLCVGCHKNKTGMDRSRH